MTIELHHLHPSHDDEVARLKARIAELEKENAELKEAQRWRKCSDNEFPEEHQPVIFLAKYKSTLVRKWFGEFRCIYGMKKEDGIFYTSSPGWGCEFCVNEVTGWMPQPSAPKEDK